MIVVDTNVIAYALLQGPQTDLALRVFAIDDGWQSPDLWTHEFLNVLVTFVKAGNYSVVQATGRMAAAVQLLAYSSHSVDPKLVLEIALKSGLSAYDAQYVALAQELSIPLVTEDRKIVRAVPKIAMTMQQFCDR